MLAAWRRNWANTEHERIRLRAVLDSLSFKLFDLKTANVFWMLRDCDHPLAGFQKAARNFDPNGFWRVDKDRHPELRYTILAQIAFHDLEDKIQGAGGNVDSGIEDFLNQNNGEGWLLPKTVRLADYGLGHDERALEHQPVASRLGPRFYDWQLAQSTEESWRECHLHARNLLGEAGYQNLLAEIEAERTGQKPEALLLPTAEGPARNNQQLPLFS